MSVLEIKNLTFKYKEHIVFDKLNLSINKGSHITILGGVGSGKTTLVKLIQKHHKAIKISGEYCIIESLPTYQIVGKTVKDQLTFHMRMHGYSNRKINNRFKKIITHFKFDDILDQDPFHLSIGLKQLVVIASYLVLDNKILVFDNAFNLLDNYHKQNLFNYLKNMKSTIICLSSNSEDALFGDRLVIINKKIVFQGPIKTAFDNDKIFTKNELSLPFMADLSLKLQYYELLDKIILDMDEMVDNVWK